MPLNYRQLSERSRGLGRAYGLFRGQLAWGRQKGFSKNYMKVKKMHFDRAQQRIIRLATILQAQKRRQYLKQSARARKIRREKLWLKRHGHMMFKSLGKRKR